MKRIGYLAGTVKHYDWGGFDFIPYLLKTTNSEKQPCAEFWLGVHPLADCKVQWKNGKEVLLRDYIQADKQALLGDAVAKRFGDLPYLFKILDVRQMLSIQVHPSKAAAEKEFARENEAGIPLTSSQRNYKDANHKPEMAVALDDFWLLHGFKPVGQLKAILASTKELNDLEIIFNEQSYKGLYQFIMEMPQDKVNAILQPLLDRVIPLYHANKLDRSHEDFWAARAALTFNKNGNIDRGIFSIYLFNLVNLKKGDGIFQAAGVPHAYLEGPNVELMANSDNVLRGGLTSKHIDVKELMKHVVCGETIPVIVKGSDDKDEKKYNTPAPDFGLSCFELKKGHPVYFTSNTCEILLITEGKATVSVNEEHFEIQRGNPAVVVFAGAEVKLETDDMATVFKATVPS
jgi:mannose-6-phosphate isomerase